VKSSDEAGNLAVSSDLSFTTVELPDTTPPVISGVVVSGQTGAEVTISWTTDEASDTQIEYGTTMGYGISTDIDPSTVFSHTQVLKGLEPATMYHFKALSSDEAGNLAVSEDYTFTTMEVAHTQTMPLIYSNLTTNDELFVGVAIMNEGGTAVTVAFTAFDESGNMIVGEGLINPAVLQIAPYQQLSLVDVEIFGNNLSEFCSEGWIRLESTTEHVRGFSLTFDGQMQLMDGVRFSSNSVNKFVFTHIESNGSTGISLINSNVEAVGVTIDLVKSDGIIRSSVSKVIDGNAAMTNDLYTELFSGVTPDSSDYVRISADQGVEPVQVIQQGTADISFLNGHDINAAASSIYLPRYQYQNKAYRTDFSVINMDSEAGNLWIRLIGNNGIQVGSTRKVQIAANGKLFIDGPEFFLDQISNEEQTSGSTSSKGGPGKFKNKTEGRGKNPSPSEINGYVAIISDGVNLVGSTSYRGRNNQSFIASFPLVTELQDTIVFGHVVSDDLYYTELAIANPGNADASVLLDLFNGQGEYGETVEISIPAGWQDNFSLKEVFQSLNYNNQTGGYIVMSSDVPVAASSLFGKYDQSVVSVIPVQ